MTALGLVSALLLTGLAAPLSSGQVVIDPGVDPDDVDPEDLLGFDPGGPEVRPDEVEDLTRLPTRCETLGGCEAWTTRHDPGTLVDVLHDVETGPDGTRVYAVGLVSEREPDRVDTDIRIVARRADDGTEVWSARIDGPAGHRDDARAIAVSPDGSTIAVAGQVTHEADPLGNGWWSVEQGLLVAAFDADTGEKRWTAHIASHSGEEGDDVAVAADGDLFVASHDTNVLHARRLDAADGSVTWTASVAGTDETSLAGDAVLDVGSGRVALAGTTNDAEGGWNLAVAAFDSGDGTRTVLHRYDGPAGGREKAQAVEATPKGPVAVGYSPGNGTSYDIATVAVGWDGSHGWVHRYNGLAGDQDAVFHGGDALAVGHGRVHVAGQSHGAGSDVVTYALDLADGDEIWTARANGPTTGWDVGHTLEIGDGTVHVAGYSAGSGGWDAIATAFDAETGDVTDAVRHGGDNRATIPRASTLTPDGTLVLAGTEFERTMVPFVGCALGCDSAAWTGAWDVR